MRSTRPCIVGIAVVGLLTTQVEAQQSGLMWSTAAPYNVAFSKDGKTVAVCGEDGYTRVFSMQTSEQEALLPTAFALGPIGFAASDSVLLSYASGQLVGWSTSTWERVSGPPFGQQCDSAQIDVALGFALEWSDHTARLRDLHTLDVVRSVDLEIDFGAQDLIQPPSILSDEAFLYCDMHGRLSVLSLLDGEVTSALTPFPHAEPFSVTYALHTTENKILACAESSSEIREIVIEKDHADRPILSLRPQPYLVLPDGIEPWHISLLPTPSGYAVVVGDLFQRVAWNYETKARMDDLWFQGDHSIHGLHHDMPLVAMRLRIGPDGGFLEDNERIPEQVFQVIDWTNRELRMQTKLRPTITLRNETDQPVTVYLKGPQSHSLSLPAQTAKRLGEQPEGQYTFHAAARQGRSFRAEDVMVSGPCHIILSCE